MAAREFPTARSFWRRHERLLLDVFLLALRSLRECGDLPKSGDAANHRLEDAISVHLAVATRAATFKLGLDFPPKHELPRQVESKALMRGPGKGKRPDFTCEIRNPTPIGYADAWLYYHVECKCLGEPSSKRWVYNKNYVKKGIHRFPDTEYGYGERSPSGAMIGYVLSMSFEQILEEVNGYLESSELGSALPIRFTESRRDGTARTSQVLDRARVHPGHFTLRHMWVDLRRHYPRPQAAQLDLEEGRISVKRHGRDGPGE